MQSKKSSQKDSKEEKIIRLRDQLLDLEGILCNIRIITDLFIPFANENCPEGAIVADLISKELDSAKEAIYRS